jgi:hypothetical protein
MFSQVKVPTGKTISVPTGLFINNEFVASVDSKEVIKYYLPHLFADYETYAAIKCDQPCY